MARDLAVDDFETGLMPDAKRLRVQSLAKTRRVAMVAKEATNDVRPTPGRPTSSLTRPRAMPPPRITSSAAIPELKRRSFRVSSRPRKTPENSAICRSVRERIGAIPEAHRTVPIEGEAAMDRIFAFYSYSVNRNNFSPLSCASQTCVNCNCHNLP